MFKERRINKKGEKVDSYRCFRYKRGCKVAFTLNRDEICFSSITQHTGCEEVNSRGKKRKLVVDTIVNLQSDMKARTEELALAFPGLSAKEISLRVHEAISKQFSGQYIVYDVKHLFSFNYAFL